MNLGTTVAVALSGGVDSAVAAHLLSQQGMAVWGVHIQLGKNSSPPPYLATLSTRLGISLEILDLRQDFAHQVEGYFIDEYFRGRTPNPCVRCNALIKFGVLWEKVKARGANYLATGHYTRLKPSPDGSLGLFRGLDRTKDQSYFLCHLPREVLPHLLFPLGDMTKQEVQAHFQRLGLPQLSSCEESQDICFISPNGYQDFLWAQRGQRGLPGDLVDRQGRVLGQHQGVENYTVGQRRGLRTPGREPYYVLEIQPESNRVVIGPRRELYSQGLRARDVNWLIEPPQGKLSATALIRYRHPGVEVIVQTVKGGAVEVIFATPQTAVTPGQAVAFYDGDRLLGGAWIEERIQ